MAITPERCTVNNIRIETNTKDINNLGIKVSENYETFKKEIYDNGKKGLKTEVNDIKQKTNMLYDEIYGNDKGKDGMKTTVEKLVTATNLKFAGLYAMSTGIIGLLVYMVFGKK